jgi:hypothetical protein
MKPEHREYKGHRVELRECDGKPELLIDDVPVRYGQLENGSYFLHEYAYDWTDDLVELAQRFIDHKSRANKIRHEREAGKEGELICMPQKLP